MTGLKLTSLSPMQRLAKTGTIAHRIGIGNMGVISAPGCRDGFCVRHVIVERDQRQPVVCHEAEVTDDPEDTAIVSVLAIPSSG